MEKRLRDFLRGILVNHTNALYRGLLKSRQSPFLLSYITSTMSVMLNTGQLSLGQNNIGHGKNHAEKRLR